MKFLPLLGQSLKGDALLDLFETHDVQVVYEYDRTHENMPDEYWAKAESLGAQFVFDENQVLKFIYLHLTDTDGFEPVDLSDSDIQEFGSKGEVGDFAARMKIETAEGKASLFGTDRDWIRLEYSSHSIHYEFRPDVLCLVTITKN